VVFNQTAARTLAGALLVMALVILLDQVTILAASVYPPNFDTAQWRFGAVGLAVGRATPVLFGDALLIGAALMAGWTGLLRVLGGLHVLAGLALLAGLAFFTLDAVEIRAQVTMAQRPGLTLGAARTMLLGGAAGLFSLWLGVRLLLVRSGGRRSTLLVVGTDPEAGGA
jgi:hypothetical protein